MCVSFQAPRKVYSRDALTTAYTQCVENKMSVRTAVKLFNIPRTTLRDRLSGKVHIDTVTTKLPLFTVLEESKFVDHIKTMASYGYGYSRQECVDLASDMAMQLGKRSKPLSIKWFLGFIKRWPGLRELKPKNLEKTRAKIASEMKISTYFKNLQKCLNEHGLADKPHLIFNLAEKRVKTKYMPPCITGSAADCSPVVESDCLKTVTILGCISASGMAIPPFFIFPGKLMDPALLNGKSPGADGTVSESGSSNHAIFRQYLMKHFIKFILERDNEKVLLILDGHQSHVSVDLWEWARENGIIFFFLPPYTSDILQPLDVSCYGPFQDMFRNECQKMMQETGAALTHFKVCEISCCVYANALSPDNAQSAFKHTGIYPLDQTAILSESLVPAQENDNGSDDEGTISTTEFD